MADVQIVCPNPKCQHTITYIPDAYFDKNALDCPKCNHRVYQGMAPEASQQPADSEKETE